MQSGPNKKYQLKLEILRDVKGQGPYYSTEKLSYDSEKDLSLICLRNNEILEIYIKSDVTDPKIKEALLYEIKKTSAMKVVTLQDDFFSKSQIKELKPVLIKNKLDYEKKHAPNFLIAAGAGALGLVAEITGYNYLALSFYSATIGSVISNMHSRYKFVSKDRYDTVKKIEAVTNPLEQEALKAGIENVDSIGYFNSFGISTAAYPRAFAAATRFKEEGKSDIVKAIARLGS